jgi:hypothetical protein
VAQEKVSSLRSFKERVPSRSHANSAEERRQAGGSSIGTDRRAIRLCASSALCSWSRSRRG